MTNILGVLPNIVYKAVLHFLQNVIILKNVVRGVRLLVKSVCFLPSRSHKIIWRRDLTKSKVKDFEFFQERCCDPFTDPPPELMETTVTRSYIV